MISEHELKQLLSPAPLVVAVVLNVSGTILYAYLFQGTVPKLVRFEKWKQNYITRLSANEDARFRENRMTMYLGFLFLFMVIEIYFHDMTVLGEAHIQDVEAIGALSTAIQQLGTNARTRVLPVVEFNVPLSTWDAFHCYLKYGAVLLSPIVTFRFNLALTVNRQAKSSASTATDYTEALKPRGPKSRRRK